MKRDIDQNGLVTFRGQSAPCRLFDHVYLPEAQLSPTREKYMKSSVTYTVADFAPRGLHAVDLRILRHM